MNPKLITRAVIIRHAPTEWNRQKRWQGSGVDPQLDSAGVAMARRFGKRFPVELHSPVVLSSPLQRSVQTAEAIISTMRPTTCVQIVDELKEFDAGKLEGLTEPEIEARWPEIAHAWRTGHAISPPGGETERDFVSRVSIGLRTICTELNTRDVLAISHIGVLRALRELVALPVVAIDPHLAGMHARRDASRGIVEWTNFAGAE